MFQLSKHIVKRSIDNNHVQTYTRIETQHRIKWHYSIGTY